MMRSGGFTIELTVSTACGAGGRLVPLGVAARRAAPPTHGPARSRRQRRSLRRRSPCQFLGSTERG